MTAGVEIRDSYEVGQVQEDERKRAVDNNSECTAVDSWDRKGVDTE